MGGGKGARVPFGARVNVVRFSLSSDDVALVYGTICCIPGTY